MGTNAQQNLTEKNNGRNEIFEQKILGKEVKEAFAFFCIDHHPPPPCPVGLDRGNRTAPCHVAHNLKLLLLKSYNYANIFSVKFNFSFHPKILFC